jgi:hypothetical protein
MKRRYPIRLPWCVVGNSQVQHPGVEQMLRLVDEVSQQRWRNDAERSTRPPRHLHGPDALDEQLCCTLAVWRDETSWLPTK